MLQIFTNSDESNLTLESTFLSDKFYWIHLENPSEEELKALQQKFSLESSTIEECISSEHYPKLEDYEDYLFFVTFFLKVGTEKQSCYETEELNIFLGKNYLVTLQKADSISPLKTLQDKARRSKRLLNAGVDFLLNEILDSLAESYIPVLEDFDNKIDHLEALIFRTSNDKTLQKIFKLKKQIMSLKRLLLPQQEMLFRLSMGEHELICERNRLLLRNVFDHFSRLNTSIESYRDLTMSLFDAFRSQASNRMNEIMKVLTVFSTIVLPLTLVVGYFGMNFEHMQEFKSPNGPAMVWLYMGLITITMLIFFRWRKWL